MGSPKKTQNLSDQVGRVSMKPYTFEYTASGNGLVLPSGATWHAGTAAGLSLCLMHIGGRTTHEAQGRQTQGPGVLVLLQSQGSLGLLGAQVEEGGFGLLVAGYHVI